MSRPPPPPAPTHLLRSHSASVSTLWISQDNERIYSGDASGNVVVSSTRSLRTISAWNAHTDSILGVEEFGSSVITHGRDNKLHVWNRIKELPASTRLGGSAAVPDLPTPELVCSMDVNALNYCRFSLLPLSSGEDSDPAALIALPNLVDSSTADVWFLPPKDRIHAAIGQETNKPVFATQPDSGRGSHGIIMSLHLYTSTSDESGPSRSSAMPATALRLLCAYEDGSVILRRYVRSDRPTSVEGQGWEVLWTSKSHVETIMAMSVSRSNTFSLTVSADNLIVRYDLISETEPKAAVHRAKHPGNSSIAIRDDGRVCAVGGWDGSVRLYSTKSLKPLGTLRYHKSNCQALAFAHDKPTKEDLGGGADEKIEHEEDSDSDDDTTASDRAAISRWLLAGGKDNRVSVWKLMSFESSSTTMT
ncbi:WD40 repeat-like protein [Coprinellus micaceus]|uniref:ASTRA-associated protein 1 n=1 Tax=Coprinellus micaceus TaxID=71717 RepID=A0A4Y7TKY3_COPMI|nr:WD40 repeat-like protein [Coprinellus micaceus]